MNDGFLIIDQDATADEIADFFCAHANPDYISHAELQNGRAIAPGQWNPDLRQVIVAQVMTVLAQGDTETSKDKIVCAHFDGRLVGVAFLSFGGFKSKKFGVLDDVIVDPVARGKRVGTQLLEWIIRYMKTEGATRLYLKSGVANHKAHDFFEHQGFEQTSIVMMRDLL